MIKRRPMEASPAPRKAPESFEEEVERDLEHVLDDEAARLDQEPPLDLDRERRVDWKSPEFKGYRPPKPRGGRL